MSPREGGLFVYWRGAVGKWAGGSLAAVPRYKLYPSGISRPAIAGSRLPGEWERGIKMNAIWEWFKTTEPSNQIQIISVLSLAVTTVILLVTAIFTYFSARATKKTSLAQTLMLLMDDYGSPEMQKSLVGVIKFKEDCDSMKDRDFRKEFANQVKEEPLCPINKQRRKYSYFFHKIYQLLNNKLVNKKFVKKLVNREMVRPLLENVEPMLKEADPKYDDRTFDTFRQLYDKLK